MFSSRFKWTFETNRLSKLIEAKKRDGDEILDLTESNPTRAGIDYPANEILGALAQIESIVYQPAPRGLLSARESVSSYYRDRGFTIDPEHIHLTSSTSEGYSYLFKLLADHGQSVLVPHPSYPLFEFLAALEGVELRPYDLRYSHPRGWLIDFDSIERSIDAAARAILVVSPNNPTGSFIKKEELERLNDICKKFDMALIADEVFGDYAFEKDENRVRSCSQNRDIPTFTLSGFSKVLALPQMKLGWIVTSGPGQLCKEAIERLDLIADTFLSVGAPVQHAAPLWLKYRRVIQEQIAGRVSGNLDWLDKCASNTPCRLLAVEGGWYATLEIPRHFTEEEWVLRILEEENVLVHPGYFFDFQREAYLVVSLLPVPGVFREAVERVFSNIEKH